MGEGSGKKPDDAKTERNRFLIGAIAIPIICSIAYPIYDKWKEQKKEEGVKPPTQDSSSSSIQTLYQGDANPLADPCITYHFLCDGVPYKVNVNDSNYSVYGDYPEIVKKGVLSLATFIEKHRLDCTTANIIFRKGDLHQSTYGLQLLGIEIDGTDARVIIGNSGQNDYVFLSAKLHLWKDSRYAGIIRVKSSEQIRAFVGNGVITGEFESLAASDLKAIPPMPKRTKPVPAMPGGRYSVKEMIGITDAEGGIEYARRNS